MAHNTADDVHILVVRSGGIAGIRQQWQLEGRGDSSELIALVVACPWDAVSADPTSADRFVWRIEAKLSQGTRRASVPDRDLIGPWRELVERVQEAGSRG
jgi:hypothetical protein